MKVNESLQYLKRAPGGLYVKHLTLGYWSLSKIDRIAPVPPPNECPTISKSYSFVLRS